MQTYKLPNRLIAIGNARLYQYDLAGRLTDVYQGATGSTGNVAGEIDAADTHLLMQAWHIRRFCKLDEKGDQLLEQVTDKLGLSARSFTRILKLTRTIADLAGEEQIQTLHLVEAIQYRGADRKLG